jgi:hypothetical protein
MADDTGLHQLPILHYDKCLNCYIKRYFRIFIPLCWAGEHSTADIVTPLQAGGPQQDQKIFRLSTSSRTALGPTQPPIDIDIDIFVNCNWVGTRWQYTFTRNT